MRVDDPVIARRTLLESTKIVIRTLQARHDLLKIRDERGEVRRLYGRKIEDVRLLIRRINGKIPKHDVRIPVQRSQFVGGNKNVVVPPPPKKVDFLEQEIGRIEERIKNLG